MSDPSAALKSLHENLSRILYGKQQQILLAIATLLCRGHLLLDDVPGVGKTMLARAIAQSLGGEFRRLQCTPDLLPSDVTGISVFDQSERAFKFMPGPVFTNILLVDEINRAPPRTQSSLLECMGERQVSIDGVARALPAVFMVIATQNPIEFHGTYPLPEAQLDRFFMRIRLGYPDRSSELKILDTQRSGSHPIDTLARVISLEEVEVLRGAVERIEIAPEVAGYAVDIVERTRTHPGLSLGASPRGSLALVSAARALALLTGQRYVTPEHVKRVAPAVLAHRVMPKPSAASSPDRAVEAAVADILGTLRVPVEAASQSIGR
jgi:MoxR-like ATPase